jgi:hypothetical protein
MAPSSLVASSSRGGSPKAWLLGSSISSHRRSTRKKRAAMAVAHSILVIIYHLLRDGVAYEEKGEAFFEEQDREFIQRRLVRQLEQLGHQVTLQPLAQAG